MARPQLLDDLTVFASSYLLAAGMTPNYQEVRRLVHGMGAQFAGFASINAISPAVLSGLVSHVRTNLALVTSPGGAHVLPVGLTAANDHGPGTGLADPRSNWLVRALLDGTFGRLDEERRPSGLSGRRDYADLASSGELSGITMASYHTSPLTRAIAGTGMTYGTFDWMRNLPGENFTRRNILHAARDATRYGFGPRSQSPRGPQELRYPGSRRRRPRGGALQIDPSPSPAHPRRRSDQGTRGAAGEGDERRGTPQD
jgi:hypothetical protein